MHCNQSTAEYWGNCKNIWSKKEQTISKSKVKIPERYHIFNKWEFQIGFNISNAFNYFSNKNYEVNKRDSVETNLISGSLHISLKYLFHKNFFIKLKINNLTFGESGNYQGYFMTPPKFLGGQPERHDTAISYKNYHNYLGVGFNIGYQTNTKLKLGIYTGLTPLIYIFKYTTYPKYISYAPIGAQHPPETNFYYNQKLDPRYHTYTPINLAYNFGFFIQYPIYNNYHISLNTDFYGMLFNMYYDNRNTTNKPYLFVGGIGISKYF